MNKTRIVMVLVAIALTMSVASATDWSQVQKDATNRGLTDDSVPIYDPIAAWYKQTTGMGMGGIDVTPVIGDEQIFVIDYQAVAWAFNKTTGQENWNVSYSPVGTFELSTPAYDDGILYVATSRGSANQGRGIVAAIYANNGTLRENVTLRPGDTSGYQLNTPVIYADGKVYVGDWNGSASTTGGSGWYYCLNASNVSDIIWTYKPGTTEHGYYGAGAAIIGDYIVFGDDHANVTCLYKDSGTFVDCIDMSDEEIRSSVVYNSGTGQLYFTAREKGSGTDYGGGHVYALSFNAATGALGNNYAWRYQINYTTSTPVYHNGRIYVGGGHRMYGSDHSGRMCCLNEANGNLIWDWNKTAGRVQASPAVSVVNGRKFIYFTTNVLDGSAYCLEDMGSNYNERWAWNPPTPDDQYILQGMAISNGTVYFGTDYGRIYALQDHFVIPIWRNNSDPKNLFAVPLKSAKTTLAVVIGNNARSNDKVYRYINGQGYKPSAYIGGTWWWNYNVEPIEPGVGYEYHRQSGGTFTITNTGQLLQNVSTPMYGILSTGDPKNLFGYATLEYRNLSAAFGANPVANDKVYRYINGQGYKPSAYIGGTWWWNYNVEPIEPGVGYEYHRQGQTFNWSYDPYNV